MKNHIKCIAVGSLFFALASCDQKTVQETQSTIKNADSLIKSANEGFKTLDSISAIVNDSAKMNRIIIPEIEKTKRTAEEAIRKNAKSLDSIAGTINKVKDQIERSSDIIKTVDSANKELQKDGSVFDKISTITGAVSKINKQTSKKNHTEKTASPQEQQTPTSIQEPIEDEYEVVLSNPMVKTGKLKIYVDDVIDAKSQLVRDLRNSGGEVVTESFGEEEGHKKELITAKLPYRYFDETLSKISAGYGDLNTKSVETEGTDYSPNQMCDIEITFIENSAQADGMYSDASPGNQMQPGSGEKKGMDKFMDDYGNAMLWLLPFIPLIIFWFYNDKRKREKHNLEILKMQQEIEAMKAQQTARQETGNSIDTNSQNQQKNQNLPPNNQNDDYTRFMPK